MWDVVLVRPGDGGAGAHLHVRRLVREVLDVQLGNSGHRSTLPGRTLLVSSHHTLMAVLATHHPLIAGPSTHHPIPIAVRHEPAVCHRHRTNRATNRQQT